MDQPNQQSAPLLDALRRQGFYRSGNRVVAPNGTLWLSYDALPYTDVDVLKREAARRLGRKRRQRHAYQSPYDWDCAVDDAEALLDAMDEVIEQSFVALPKAS